MSEVLATGHPGAMEDNDAPPAWGPSPSSAPDIPPRRKKLSLAVSVALGLLTAAVAVWLLAYFFSKDANKDAQRVFVNVGNCYRDRGGEGVLVTEAYQPCASPHDREVVGLVSFNDSPQAPYPGRDQLARTTDQACPQRFKAYVGAPYPAAGLVLRILFPTPGEWADGFRDGVCAVADAGGMPLTTTVRGRSTARG